MRETIVSWIKKSYSPDKVTRIFGIHRFKGEREGGSFGILEQLIKGMCEAVKDHLTHILKIRLQSGCCHLLSTPARCLYDKPCGAGINVFSCLTLSLQSERMTRERASSYYFGRRPRITALFALYPHTVMVRHHLDRMQFV